MIAWVVKADRETLDDIATLVLGQGRIRSLAKRPPLVTVLLIRKL